MGRGFGLKCRKCRYSYGVNMGVGFSFPLVYQETIEAGKKGKLGEEVKAFLEEHPNGALNCDQVLLQCASCDALDQGMDLSMYLPVKGNDVSQGKWSVAYPFEECSYVAPRDLEKYRLVCRYHHVCCECGGEMKVINEDNLVVGKKEPWNGYAESCVKCPICKKPMVINDFVMWD